MNKESPSIQDLQDKINELKGELLELIAFPDSTQSFMIRMKYIKLEKINTDSYIRDGVRIKVKLY